MHLFVVCLKRLSPTLRYVKSFRYNTTLHPSTFILAPSFTFPTVPLCPLFTTHSPVAMKVYDARIVVLLLDDMASGVNFLKRAHDMGAITAHTILLGTGRISNHNLWDTFPTDAQHPDSMVAKILGGYLGVDFADRDWMVATPAGARFVSKFLALPPTVRTVGGTVQCSSARDDDGRLLYQYVDGSGRTVCLGMDYSALGADSLDPLVGYAYDATTLALRGLLEQADGSMRVPGPALLGVDLCDLIIEHPGVQGVTGRC